METQTTWHTHMLMIGCAQLRGGTKFLKLWHITLWQNASNKNYVHTCAVATQAQPFSEVFSHTHPYTNQALVI